MTRAIDITHLAPIEAPQALRDLPAWLIWKFEPHDNPGGKPRKVPYYAAGGRRFGDHGTPEDRRQLTTFDAARSAAARRGFDGVGFAPLADWGVVALDFDNCVDDSGEILPDVQALLGTTYAELSPSGRGVRAFFRGQLGNRKSAKGWPFGMETFSTNGFVTFTGNVLPLCELMGNADEVAPVDDTVLALYNKRFAREIERQQLAPEHQDRVGLDERTLQRALDAIPNNDLDYDQWLTIGMAIHHETNGEGFDLWDEFSQRSSKYTSREYGWDRWRSFDRSGGPMVTARTLIKLANEHGAAINLSAPASPEDFEVLVDNTVAEAQKPGGKPLKYTFEHFTKVASATSLSWLVKGLLPKASLAVMYGASGSGKSFAMLDLCLHIVRGEAWRGRRVKQSRVAYIVAEGVAGFEKRLAAHMQHLGITEADWPFQVLRAAPNLMQPEEAAHVVAGVRASGGADLIVVDTLAQTMPGGNENAGEDMGKVLGYCKLIHQQTGAMVLLVHHSGKDQAKGARGWSGLRAACDAEIEVVRPNVAAPERSLQLTKSKDGEDGLQFWFKLNTVELGVDEDLDPITSCVVEHIEEPPQGGKAEKFAEGASQQIVWEVLKEFGEVQAAGVEKKAVLDEAVRRMEPPSSGMTDGRRSNASRALTTMLKKPGFPWVWEVDGKTLCLL